MLAGGAVEPGREQREAAIEDSRRRIALQQPSPQPRLVVGEHWLDDRAQAPALGGHELGDGGATMLPSPRLDVLEGEKEHRMAAEVSAHVVASAPDLEVGEERAAIFGAALDVGGQGREVERLAEAPRPRQQQHAGVGAQHIDDERGFVDVERASAADVAEVRGADGEAGRRHGWSVGVAAWVGEGLRRGSRAGTTLAGGAWVARCGAHRGIILRDRLGGLRRHSVFSERPLWGPIKTGPSSSQCSNTAWIPLMPALPAFAVGKSRELCISRLGAAPRPPPKTRVSGQAGCAPA